MTSCSRLRFEWDPEKARSNRAKHGIAFHEATELFTSGEDYLELVDETRSENEERFVAVGRTGRGVVVVVYTEPEDDMIRIISAREATRREKRRYWRFMGSER